MTEEKAVDTSGTAAPADSTLTDAEVRIAALEAEKAKLTEESANYKLGMLKAKKALKDGGDPEEDEDERIRRIALQTLADSRLTEIAREQEVIIKQALKENKELKLANLNKTGAPPAAVGTHSEGIAVVDTLVTPEQLAAFKARGWTEKDIERYKRNIQKNTR